MNSIANSALAPATPSELDDLRERTRYEAWFLDAVCEVSEESDRSPGPSELIYPTDGGKANKTGLAVVRCVIGDWRPGFLQAGAPLVVVTTFKLLDMLIEWILGRNEKKVGFRFQEKLRQLDGTVLFPVCISQRPWLHERMLGLYSGLEPLRGTIVHQHAFASSNGELTVAASKSATPGPSVRLSSSDIRQLARVVVQMLRMVTGELTPDRVGDKRLRHALDQLIHVHQRAHLGQLWPEPVVVKKSVSGQDSVEIDFDQIKADATRLRVNAEPVLLGLDLSEVAADGKAVPVWFVPWEQLKAETGIVRFTRDELARFAVRHASNGAQDSEPTETVEGDCL